MPASLSPIRRFPSRRKRYNPRFVNNLNAVVSQVLALTTAATSLELFDFPLDAHALWNLSTATVLALKWYDVSVEDSLDTGWREQNAPGVDSEAHRLWCTQLFVNPFFFFESHRSAPFLFLDSAHE